MTTEPFTPHADSIQTAWVLMCQQSRISTQPPVEELEAEFDRFLARVRREAKAEALREAADDAEVRAAAFAVMELDGDRGLDGFTYSRIARAALSAARTARRDEEKR